MHFDIDSKDDESGMIRSVSIINEGTKNFVEYGVQYAAIETKLGALFGWNIIHIPTWLKVSGGLTCAARHFREEGWK